MTLALIAGNGSLPTEIVGACIAKNKSLLVIDICHTPRTHLEWVHSRNDLIQVRSLSLGNIGQILQTLKENNIRQLIFAGGVERPNLGSFSLDKTGLIWLKKLGMKAFKGDDALLKGITELLATEGFEVLPASAVLPNIITPLGCLTNTKPTQDDWAAIQQGQALLKALSPFDVGQAVVIQQGLVLGIEAIEGTEQLLHRCGNLQRQGHKGVLVKRIKDGQMPEADLPSIGPETMHQLDQARLGGVAVSSRTSQIIQREKTVDLANSLGLFIVGVE